MRGLVKEVLWGLACAVGGILAFEGTLKLKSGYPFCVVKNGSTYKIDKATLAVVSSFDTGQTGFAPIDPEDIRATEKQVACPKSERHGR